MVNKVWEKLICFSHIFVCTSADHSFHSANKLRICENKYGVCDGKHQELEGPDEAKKLLNEIGNYTYEQIERICWLVGHHHTYTHIYGIDYQLLVEADFLVNIYEDGFTDEMIENVRNKIFKTHSGIRCLENMYLRNR